MYKKKKSKFIVIIAIILLLIGLVLNFFIKDRNLTIFEKAIKDSVLTVERLISYPIDYIINKNINEVNVENKYKAENDELKKQLNDLKKITNTTTLSEYTKLNATVVSRNIDTWQDIITINKGEKDGVKVGMAVVIENNLIGKIINTSFYNSTVRLITANDVIDKISVKINNDNYLYGILSKDNDKHIIEGLSSVDKIKKDSLVTTTGMGNIYPSGIIIGKVVGMKSDNFDLSQVLEVKSLIDFDNLYYVTILKRNI